MDQANPVILAAEDDALLRVHAAALLEENGFGVVEAENADAALKLMETAATCDCCSPTFRCRAPATGWTWPDRFTLGGRVLLIITSGQIKPTEAEIPDHGHFIGLTEKRICSAK